MFKKAIFVIFICTSCNEIEKVEKKDPYLWIPLQVSVTAYNSVPWQTDSLPTLAAWGDTLKPGMKAIAVSRDLIKKGLKHNTMVKIDTFPDTFLVKDKMHWKWRNKIDIYMGENVRKARKWGRKKGIIKFRVLRDSFMNVNSK